MSLTEVEYAPAGAAAAMPNAGPDALPLKARTGVAEPWRINSYFVALVHVVGALTLIFHRPTWQTLVLTFATFNVGAVGITMGYHRLWSHRAFTASLPLRVFLAFAGTLAFQASIKWWVLRHRLHHRYTDTEHDPYDSTRGLFFSHIGWIFRRPYYPRIKSIDISDLVADPVVRFQHKHYVALAMICGFVLPTVVASMWGDALGGYLWGGFIARLAIWHCTFMINSFAHWGGDQPYATGVSAKGSLILAFFTWGEGYHNFHHEFPKDYRNGVGMWDWDPTKWGIYLFSRLGLASGLCRAPADEIQKALISVEEIQLRDERRRWAADDGIPSRATREEFSRVAVREDPGGARSGEGGKVLQKFRGKDAHRPFNDGLTFRNNTAARTAAKAIAVEG